MSDENQLREWIADHEAQIRDASIWVENCRRYGDAKMASQKERLIYRHREMVRMLKDELAWVGGKLAEAPAPFTVVQPSVGVPIWTLRCGLPDQAVKMKRRYDYPGKTLWCEDFHLAAGDYMVVDLHLPQAKVAAPTTASESGRGEG